MHSKAGQVALVSALFVCEMRAFSFLASAERIRTPLDSLGNAGTGPAETEMPAAS